MKFDNFKPMAVEYGPGRTTEIEISDNGEMARYRITMHKTSNSYKFYGYWQLIRYNRRGQAYIRDWHNYSSSFKKLYLQNFQKY